MKECFSFISSSSNSCIANLMLLFFSYAIPPKHCNKKSNTIPPLPISEAPESVMKIHYDFLHCTTLMTLVASWSSWTTTYRTVRRPHRPNGQTAKPDHQSFAIPSAQSVVRLGLICHKSYYRPPLKTTHRAADHMSANPLFICCSIGAAPRTTGAMMW